MTKIVCKLYLLFDVYNFTFTTPLTEDTITESQ